MQRGFKSRCEEMAISLRTELGLREVDPLPPEQLADYLDVFIWPVTELELNEDDLRQLLVVDSNSWSAITVSAAGYDALVTNPLHRSGRLSSDLMHELSHLLLGHEPTTMYVIGDEGLTLREYDPSKEKEADWLAGALLLPRKSLLTIVNGSTDYESVCHRFGVSLQMLKFRMSVTGVKRQMERRRRIG